MTKLTVTVTRGKQQPETGEICIIGRGKMAYCRIETIDADGKRTCAWIDNNGKLRRFLRAALNRCEK